MKGSLAFLALLLLGCGSRTSLSTRDASAFVDDDPFIKLDGAAGPATARTSDGPTGGGALAPDAAQPSAAAGELAVRDIAKLLWEAEPDRRHLELARAGQLRSRVDLENVVREVLKDPRAAVGVGKFYRWWLHLDGLKSARKDPQLFPLFPRVTDALIDDVVSFGVSVTLSDGHFSTLMTASRPYADMSLAALVGDSGDNARRAGILARPGWLALHARPERASPSNRGLAIRQDLLCEEVPPNPAGFGMLPPQPPDMTNRQHYASLTAQPECKACHVLLDDIGFGLENFDAVGAFRVIDHGLMIDARGVVRSKSGEVPFNGAPELGKLLAVHPEAQQCIVSKWYQYLQGAPAQSGEPLARAQATFARSGGDLREVIVTILGARPL